MLYSVIIPVYNRPVEVEELLESLTQQTFKTFEVLIVEDGSTLRSDEVVEEYADKLNVRYFYKENTGPGISRNYGFERAKGDYFIIFDSDCIIPPQYFQVVDGFIKKHQVDAFGGPDAAHPSFTPIQKAISYSMTSFFTTGGIRGKKKHLGPYHPRSFNMGISREVFEVTGGFPTGTFSSSNRYGEDLDFSIRIINSGFITALIPEAFVYHKRRTNFLQFFWQLYYSGEARINLYKMYPNQLKLVHFFPAAFILYLVLTEVALFINPLLYLAMFSLLLLYFTLIFFEAAFTFKSIYIGLLSIIAAIVQLTAYGVGFIKNVWEKIILGND